LLDLMRKHARNWIMKVLLGIIIVVFVFYFGSLGRGRQAEIVATVDGKAIGYADLQKEYQTLVQFYRQRLGAMMTDEMVKELNLKQKALDNLVQQAMILQKAKELKLAVTDRDVQDAIMATPAFRRGGVFDEKIYNQVLRLNKLTPEEFESFQKNALIMTRFVNLIQDGVKVSDRDVHDLYRFQNEKMDLRFIRISPKDFRSKVSPGLKELEEYLKEHGNKFRTAEQIQVKYIVFSGADHASTARITDVDIADYYDRHADQFKKTGSKPVPLSEAKTRIMAELRQIRGMQMASDAAKKAHDAIYQSEDFDGYASKNGLKHHTTAFFTAANPPDELGQINDLAKVIFSLQKDETGKVLSDSKAYYLFKVVAKKPAFVPTLPEVRTQVEKAYVDEASIRMAKQEAETVLNRLKKGESFNQVVQEKGLQVFETGFILPGAAIPKLGSSPELNEALFPLTVNKPYPDRVFPADGDFIVLQLKERAGFDDREFSGKKEVLKKNLIERRKNDVLQAWVEGTKAAMMKDGRLTIQKDLKEI
jgi:peptidyl-prolyl cis-trans isomerase D